MTPEERQVAINRNKAVQALAQIIIHDPNRGADTRQAARDTAVRAHTVLARLKGGKG